MIDTTKLDGVNSPPPPLRVLVVEDNPRDAQLTVALLESGGYKVQFDVTDLPESFRKHLESAEYDMILADINLPNWTAFDALKILSQSGKDIPLIVVTDSPGDEGAVECIKQGAADFVLKDRPARLPTAVQRALEEKRLRQKRLGAEAENVRLAAIVNSSDDAIFSTTREGLIATWNPGAEHMFGYAADEIKEKHFSILIPEERRADVAGNQERLFRGEALTHYEHENVRKDGSRIRVLLTLSPIKDATGFVTGISVIARDITERKRAEEAQGRLAAIVESSTDAIFSKSLDGVIESWNRGAEQLYGYSPQEAVGQSVTILAPPGGQDEIHVILARIVKGERLEQYETRRLRKDGQEIDVSLVVSPIKDATGKVVGASTIARNITERKRTEAEKTSLVAAIEQSAEGVVITDTSGDIEYVNPAFTWITGYSREEALGQNPRILKSSKQDPLFYREIWATILAGKTWKGELINQRKDGSLYTEQMAITPVRDARGETTHYIATKQDVTERKILEQQLQQAAKIEAVGRLAGGVAHDFNNLLTVINGYSDLLLETLGSDQKARAFVNHIRGAGERAESLTRQLLAFSRRQVLAPRVLNLNEVVTNVAKMLTRLIGEDIKMRTVLDPTLGRVKADPGQIEQVIMNLAVNARDAMPTGGSLAIETSNVELDQTYTQNHLTVRPGPHVMLAVSDTGTGMTPETKARIFEPFFTTKEIGKGTGLGLATVYGIVKQSGGSIWVYSEPGQGTIFKVYFPAVNESPAEKGRAQTETDTASGTETILVVEDEEEVRSLVRTVLEPAGYKVLLAKDGENALAKCAVYGEPIHLLLTDVVMPRMAGPVVAQKIVSICPDVKVLYMSGYTDDAIVHHGVLTAGLPFIQKPLSPAALRKKVREVLDRK